MTRDKMMEIITDAVIEAGFEYEEEFAEAFADVVLDRMETAGLTFDEDSEFNDEDVQ